MRPHHRITRLIVAAIVGHFSLILASPSSAQEQGAIRGQISDARGVPLVRASVSIVGTSLATLTDARGEYHLANVPAGSAQVVVSSVG